MWALENLVKITQEEYEIDPEKYFHIVLGGEQVLIVDAKGDTLVALGNGVGRFVEDAEGLKFEENGKAMRHYELYEPAEWNALSLEEKIRHIPLTVERSTGFTKSEERYQQAAQQLKVCADWTDDRIFQFLRGLYWSAASEFGS
jgi:hypothetical protein